MVVLTMLIVHLLDSCAKQFGLALDVISHPLWVLGFMIRVFKMAFLNVGL